MSNTKPLQIVNILKEYIIPVIIFLFGLGVMWASFKYDIVENVEAIESVSMDVEGLQVQWNETDDVINLILQRLEGIDVKLDYIIKNIDSR